MNTTTKILLCIGIFIVLFIISMIVIFCVKGYLPDVLIQYTLGAGGVEALLCAVIKATKVLKGNDTQRKDYEDYGI